MMFRALLSCALLLALAACGEPTPVEPDAQVVTDPPLLDAGRPVIDPPPPAPATGCGEDEALAPSDLFAGEWDRRFLLPGLGGATPAATALAALDDGSIVVGGDFASVGTLRVSNIARWHPARGWEELGDGLAHDVTALATDGTTIYAATREGGEWPPPPVQGRVSRWTGTSWESVGAFDGVPTALALGADGALYVGGYLADVDGVAVANLARWRDGAWSAVSDVGPDGEVSVILPEADSLCVGGNFGMVGDLTSTGVACLVDGAWEARSLPEYGGVTALVRDPADGTLIAGGHFTIDSSDPNLGGSIARWTGARWELVGGGLHNFGMIGPGYVEGLAIIDGVIHVAGAFGLGGSGTDLVMLESVAALGEDGRWQDLDGGLKKRLGVSLGSVVVLGTTVDANGRFIAGGLFSQAGTQSVIGVAAWDGTYWRGLASADRPPIGGINGNVEAMAAKGSCALYVGGTFEYAGDVRANNVARFDVESGWHPLGDGVPFSVIALAVTDRIPATGPDAGDGTWIPIGGPHGALYAAGSPDFGASTLVLWDGREWREIGTFDAMVYAIAVDEDGAVVVGGDFTRVGDDQPALGVARWDGVRWRALESGVDGGVRALRFLDDGRLLVGGSFRSAGGVPSGGAAIWDGAGWAPLGEGLEGAYGAPAVEAFAVIDDVIYAAGDFVESDGRPLENVARFDGTDWAPVGDGLPGLFVQDMRAIGDVLVAVGHFEIDGAETTFAAFVDGAWQSFPSATDDLVMAIEPRPEGLYLGGPFINAAEVPSVGVALYRYAEAE